MVQVPTERQIVETGLRENKGVDWIQTQLSRHGYNKNYNPAMYVENYKNLAGNALSNAKNMARDLRTFGGLMLRPIMNIEMDVAKAKKGEKLNALKKSFKEAVNDDRWRKMYGGAAIGGLAGSVIPRIGTLGGAMAGAMLGASTPKETINALLSTYNLNANDFSNLKNTPIKDIPNKLSDMSTRAAQGVFDNPIYAGFDLAPLYAKPLGKAMSGVSNKLPTAVRQLIPDEKTRMVNRALTNSLNASGTRYANRAQSYMQLGNYPNLNREELLKNIIFNTGDLSNEEKALARSIKKDLKTNEQEAIRLGLISKEEAEANAIAQYVTMSLGNKDIKHIDILNKILTGDYGRNISSLKNNLKLENKINSLIEKGKQLYNKNNISFFTQAISPSKDPLGEIIASDYAKRGAGYFGTDRIIGQQDINTLSKVFDDSLKYQLDQVSKYSSADEAIRNISSEFGLGTINNKNKKFVKDSKNLIAINPDKFKKLISGNAKKLDNKTINNIIKGTTSYNKGDIILDKLHLDMVANAFDVSKQGPLAKILNVFKKVVLASPHWIALNRIGNVSNNLIAGVSPSSYIDAFRYGKFAPDRLKQQTSFYSYINNYDDLARNPKFSGWINQSYNKLKRSIDKFDVSEKKLEDYAKLGTNVLSSVNDFTTAPFFKAEAGWELLDRYANFIDKAKKIAAKEGKDWKRIVRKANKDDKLFNKINDMVNKELGDYIGRNYAIPKGVYDSLSVAMPFYRFLSQTARVTGDQLRNHPLSFALSTSIPARFGNKYSEDVINKYNLYREMYKGGLPYRIKDNDIRTFGFEPLPIGAITEDMQGMAKLESPSILKNPLFAIKDAVDFIKFGRMAKSPASVIEGKDHKATPEERLRLILGFLGNNFVHPYRVATTFGPEGFRALSGEGLYPRYDTNPFTETFLGYERTMPIELVGKWLGVQTFDNYPKAAESKRTIKARMRRQANIMAKQEYNKRLRKEKSRGN